MSRAPAPKFPRKGFGRKSRRLLATAALTVMLLGPQAGQQANAQQGISLLRDAEIERILRDYTDPISKAAGLAPADVSLYLVGSNNAVRREFTAHGIGPPLVHYADTIDEAIRRGNRTED